MHPPVVRNQNTSIRLKILSFSLLLALLFTTLTLHAQNYQSPLDSLQSIARNASNTGRLTIYKKIFWYLIDTQPDLVLAKQYNDSIKTLSENLNDLSGQYEATFNYGVIALHLGDYNLALKEMTRYTDYYASIGDSSMVDDGLFYSGIIYDYLGNYDKSLMMFYRILAITEKSGDQENMANTLNIIGSIYKKTTQHSEAIKTYSHASKVFSKLNLPVEYGMCLQNMANVYVILTRYDSARVLYEESLEIFKKHNQSAFVATTLGNLGNLHDATHEYQQAMRYHQQALSILRKSERNRSLAKCYSDLGKSYLHLKNYSAAEHHLDSALQILEDIKAMDFLAEAYANMHQLYLAKKNYERAYHFYVRSNQIQDSIFNADNAERIHELQARYDLEKKDKQIALLGEEKAVQERKALQQATVRNSLIAGVILLGILVALLTYIFRQRIKNQKLLAAKNNEIREIQFQKELHELEIKALRAQINPHFLFNCMNSINRMIVNGDSENATLYLKKFSKLVRLMLESSEAATVTLESELILLEAYIQLEALRFKGRIRYHITVDESIQPSQTYLPTMVLQPFVENAIWHGIMHKENNEEGYITITIRERDGELLCIIEDNGVGREMAKSISEQSIMKSKSLGLKITEERLKLLGHKPLEKMIEFIDLKDNHDHAMGTRVEINIPVEHD